LIEINNYVVEGLVDIGASTSIMAIAMVKELGIMHLVIRFETSKVAYGVVTQAMVRIKKYLLRLEVYNVLWPLWQ
jgi:predicted aspartyl protease